MKIGLDYHGVIDIIPLVFVKFSKSHLKDPKNELHIITGNPWSQNFEDHLKSYNDGEKWWTHFFSINDTLSNQEESYTIDENGGKMFNDKMWCEAKSIYCAKHHIDLHVDDRMEYLKHFTTACTLFRVNPNILNKYPLSEVNFQPERYM